MTNPPPRRAVRHSLAALAAAMALVLAPGCGERPPSDPLQAQAWEHGIEILGVQLMAGGNFARLNYRVVDYEKARRAFRDEIRLGAEGSAHLLPVASTGRLGPLRQRPSSSGRPQFMLFTNYERGLVKGGRAFVEIGERRIDGIPVI